MRSLPLAAFSVFVKPEPISLPFTRGHVALTLDGQILNFWVDSGSARSFAFYGPVYEEVFGKDSCGRSPYGCYFCPPENPCDDILSRKVWTVALGSDDLYKYVKHTVTLGIGNYTLENFSFGLVMKHPSRHRTSAALLGLSLGRSTIPETFLEQLKKRRVIDTLSYSIHASEQGPAITGKLTLDDSETAKAPYIPFSRDLMFGHAKIAVPAGPLVLLDSLGEQLNAQRRSEEMKPALVDSGASSVYVSERDFDKIIDVTWSAMCRERSRSSIKKKKQLQEEDGLLRMVRKEALPYLPTLGYKIGDPPNTIEIRMEPKHYVHSCDAVWCRMNIRPRNLRSASFGHPFFRAYNVKFDLDNKLLSFISNSKGNSTPSAGVESTHL
ncbi:hypothetical protein FOZ61_004263 [Perkinsus olseni]|uniref:Peptidase A1 domain-containing protein n=1 Tax=Perkinsus olseni TaxID=32597 RepID=A0A7J6LLC8_PEROL|nr:hypothetical protein FOZ61_004263 [Perkinsus olseni]KAF4664853.1 hypothetical protein FOL46_003989 [Perkinsus olseni]